MTHPSTLLIFCIASLVLIITPGPNNLYIIARGIGQGRKEGIMSALGVHTGTLFHITAAALGLSALLVSSALAFNLVKYIGAAYLIYLGVRTLWEPQVAKQNAMLERQSFLQIYYQGMLTNILNPKVAVFFLAFLPQFVDVSRGAVTGQILFLGIVLLLMGLAVDLVVALLAGTMGHWLRNSTRFWRVQKWVTGSTFIGLGLSTAFVGTDRK